MNLMSLMLEALENRRMMAYTYTFIGGVITIGLPGSDDVVAGNVSGGGTLTITVKEGGGPTAPVDTWPIGSVTSININLGSGNDTINLSNITRPTTINGALGNDSIVGGNGNDSVTAGGGNDTINGSGGHDRIDGGGNNDSILGGTGEDTVDYSTRTAGVTAVLDGTAGNGEAGENDTLGADLDSILGGAGNDNLTGNNNPNYLYGGLGNDVLAGGGANDIICGGAGRDTMYGNDGNDSIFALDGEIDVIDGGPGTDGAQTDPAEGAPVPGEDVIIPDDTTAPFMGPTPLFSSQPISRPTKAPAKRASPTLSPAPRGPAASAPPLPGGPAPGGPGGFGGDAPKEVEFGIDSQGQIDELARFLLPYTLGQILVTRNFQGHVHITGTPAEDEIAVQTFGKEQPLVNIENNGGVVQFVLPTPQMFVNNRDGLDRFTVRGDRKSSIAWFEPTKEPNVGSFTLDDRKITYGLFAGAAPLENFLVQELAKFKIVTPAVNDFLTLQGPGPRDPLPRIGVQGVSDNVVLPNMEVEGVSLVEVDIGTNEPQGGDSRDFLTLVDFSELGTQLMLTPSNPTAPSGNNTVQVEGKLILVNNPTLPDRAPTVDFDLTQSPASVQFLAPLTQVRDLLLGPASTAIVGPGDATLVVKKLDMFTGAGAPPANVDLTDGSLIIDHDGDEEVLPFVRQQIFEAYGYRDPQHWLRPGIGSSRAAERPGTGVGYAEAALLFGKAGALFRGVRLDDTATLVSYTLLGDADLNRTVDFNDLARLAQNYNRPGNTHTWLQGDFTYEGAINFDDLSTMAQNYNKSLFT